MTTTERITDILAPAIDAKAPYAKVMIGMLAKLVEDERDACATRLEVAADQWAKEKHPGTERLMNLATLIRTGNFER